MKGRVIIAGTMQVDGEELTGVFVEVKKEELKAHAGNIVYRNVEIHESKTETK